MTSTALTPGTPASDSVTAATSGGSIAAPVTGMTTTPARENDCPIPSRRLSCSEVLMMRVAETNPAASAMPRPIAANRAQWARIWAKATEIIARSARSGR
ncbi:Uncharacterised protein [Mycobacteroides abscessus subsp. abscessus]|nr:Uncharacterised protein [Mycobacteroides abscessus subsp. abscessus]